MMIDKPTFGPGGNSESFYEEGNKATVNAPKWVFEKGLDAYEFEAGNGLNAGEATLRKIGDEARKYGVLMSFHTPYFISLSGIEEEKRLKSVEYIRKSLWAGELLGADTIVVHSGSAAKISRDEAMALASDTLSRVADEFADTKIHIGLETMGKINQLGTLDEVIRLCGVSKIFHPVVDFGHMNARNVGGYFTDVDSYRAVFDKIGSALGREYVYNLHCHFSKIEYTGAGEKKHLTFADTVYGPEFEPLAKAIVAEGVCPRIICESDGTMAEDALEMKKLWQSCVGGM